MTKVAWPGEDRKRNFARFLQPDFYRVYSKEYEMKQQIIHVRVRKNPTYFYAIIV